MKNGERTGSLSDGSSGWRNGSVVGVSDDAEDEEGSRDKGPRGAMGLEAMSILMWLGRRMVGAVERVKYRGASVS